MKATKQTKPAPKSFIKPALKKAASFSVIKKSTKKIK